MAGDDATMPTNGNEMMLEQLERVETRLGGVETRLGDVETRLGDVETRLGDVEATLERIETEVNRVDERLGSLESRVDTRFGRVEIQLEDVREALTKFTDTFGGPLDALTRDIAESRKEFVAKFLDHDRVLTNHNQRITALERQPRRQT
jgi:archaellum component FlaC